MSILTNRITLRPVVLPDDESFLLELFADTQNEIADLPIEESQKRSLIEMQYKAQRRQYAAQFPDAAHLIVLFEGQPVGRYLYVDGAKEIIAIDLTVLAEHRSRGIGSAVLSNTIEKAAGSGKKITLHVLTTNQRAKSLYEQLGFKTTGMTPTRFEMEWSATPQKLINEEK